MHTTVEFESSLQIDPSSHTFCAFMIEHPSVEFVITTTKDTEMIYQIKECCFISLAYTAVELNIDKRRPIVCNINHSICLLALLDECCNVADVTFTTSPE
jgi:hypothetical protein